MQRLGESRVTGFRPAQPPAPSTRKRIKPFIPPPADACELETGLLRRERVIHLIDSRPRNFKRMVATLEFPAPDRIIGRTHRWHRRTVLDWLASQGLQPQKGV